MTSAFLALPGGARAHGDPVSETLIEESIFLPLEARIDQGAMQRLQAVVREAGEAEFDIKVAVISEPADLGPRFQLYNDAQQCAEVIAADLSVRLLVVTPRGFGYAVSGRSAPRFSRALNGLAVPGRDATQEARAATVAVRRLATVGGHVIRSSGSGSETRDRITIAAAAVAGVALIAGLLLLRRQRRAPPD